MRVKTQRADKVRNQSEAVKTKKDQVASSKARFVIKSTFNNTSIFVYEPSNGELIVWSSAGRSGFKGTRQGTPYAAGVTANNVAREAMDLGIKEAQVEVKGIGQGREQAIRALANAGLEVTSLKDTTPIPHNGCRPRKVRKT